jgi:hypothetical protein
MYKGRVVAPGLGIILALGLELYLRFTVSK